MKWYIENRRILKAFGSVLDSLPEETRELIRSRVYIFSDSPVFFSDITKAEIEKEKIKGGRYGGLSEPYPDGSYIVVIFRRSLRLKDEKLRCVIAHELAHVYCGHVLNEDKTNSKACEIEAIKQAEMWGYPHFDMDLLLNKKERRQ